MAFDFDELGKLKDNIKSSIDDGTFQEKVKKVAEAGVETLNDGISSINNIINSETEKTDKTEKNEQNGRCPNCNGPLEISTDKTYAVCAYCNSKIDMTAKQTVVDKIFTFVNQQQEMEEKRRILEEKKYKASLPLRMLKAVLRTIVLLVFLMMAFRFFDRICNQNDISNPLKEFIPEVVYEKINQYTGNGY